MKERVACSFLINKLIRNELDWIFMETFHFQNVPNSKDEYISTNKKFIA